MDAAWKDPYNRREMEAVKKLKKLGLLHACNFTADSALQSKLYKLCEQYAKNQEHTLSLLLPLKTILMR
ncbi:hypothetical protein DRO59_05900 [Candidatus Bathyarchaeota archaeon]|nr:MAG: hypothetical protein DRO59_05900 [Candidatus Bathyarchaeota archaeon]